MSKKNTCFVISPIGESGSEVRKNADDLFDLVVLPALEKYGFDVLRADKIPGTGSITSDIVQLLQQATLCVVDLTYQNPNVFYECGRRHETGKPMIQLIKKGESIPFDLAGVRTITYDLSSPRSVRETALTVQGFVESLDLEASNNQSSGESLSSITEILHRIEAQINNKKETINETDGYRLDRDEVNRVQVLIDELRKEIASSDKFSDEHKVRLLSKLERLQKEIHKPISDMDRFFGLVGEIGVIMGKFGKDVKPIVDRMKEIAKIGWEVQAKVEGVSPNQNLSLAEGESAELENKA